MADDERTVVIKTSHEIRVVDALEVFERVVRGGGMSARINVPPQYIGANVIVSVVDSPPTNEPGIRKWTDEEIEVLRARFPSGDLDKLAADLGRGTQAIEAKAVCRSGDTVRKLLQNGKNVNNTSLPF